MGPSGVVESEDSAIVLRPWAISTAWHHHSI
jgi:hypothetical protein